MRNISLITKDIVAFENGGTSFEPGEGLLDEIVDHNKIELGAQDKDEVLNDTNKEIYQLYLEPQYASYALKIIYYELRRIHPLLRFYHISLHSSPFPLF